MTRYRDKGPSQDAAGSADQAQARHYGMPPGPEGRPRMWWGCTMPVYRVSQPTEPADDGWWTEDRCSQLVQWLVGIRPMLIALLARPDHAAELLADRHWAAKRARELGGEKLTVEEAARRRPAAKREWLQEAASAAMAVGAKLRRMIARDCPGSEAWRTAQQVGALLLSPTVLARLWEAGWIPRPSHLVPPACAIAAAAQGKSASEAAARYRAEPTEDEDLFGGATIGAATPTPTPTEDEEAPPW